MAIDQENPPSLPPANNNTNNHTNKHHCSSNNYQKDMMDPYFMHPSDNLGVAIISPPLNNLNYHSQSRSIVVALRSKNKLGFLDGTLPRPAESDSLTLTWDRCNTMVMAGVINSVEPDIAQSILWMDTAAEIWTELFDRYHQGDIF
ncbi:unnamed protein product [Vicia faba]|uniref:Retrotransposon Copia-like N-terminal domain-containing protein n=1 Tax=Vicia faba TaxID=3906 RepID=A0AAV1AMB4_VICFA|nr:unnamed protein product [Vicia faba]